MIQCDCSTVQFFFFSFLFSFFFSFFFFSFFFFFFFVFFVFFFFFLFFFFFFFFSCAWTLKSDGNVLSSGSYLKKNKRQHDEFVLGFCSPKVFKSKTNKVMLSMLFSFFFFFFFFFLTEMVTRSKKQRVVSYANEASNLHLRISFNAQSFSIRIDRLLSCRTNFVLNNKCGGSSS